MLNDRREMAARQFVGVKIADKGVDWIDQIVMEENGRDTTMNINRSDVIRTAIALAAQNDRDFRLMLRCL